MNLSIAHNILAVRLYDWSLRDLLRELETDCPLLNLIGKHQRRIGGFVAWNRTLSPNERMQLAKALLLYHQNARTLKGEIITEEAKCWGEAYYEQTTIHMEHLPPLATAFRDAPTFRPVDGDVLLDTLLSVLPPVLGRPSRRRSKIICTCQIHDWKIVTEFVFERRRENLAFEYQFIRKDGAPKLGSGFGPFPRSLLSFYGMYPRTYVGVPSQADIEPTTKAMSKLAEHFVSQAEPLFEGLGIND
jgi:hypothetical protein